MARRECLLHARKHTMGIPAMLRCMYRGRLRAALPALRRRRWRSLMYAGSTPPGCSRPSSHLSRAFCRVLLLPPSPSAATLLISQGTPQFGYWRQLLWPVHSYELRKVLTMFLMFMCINFNYTLLRNTKDTLVVTAAGAERVSLSSHHTPSAVGGRSCGHRTARTRGKSRCGTLTLEIEA